MDNDSNFLRFKVLHNKYENALVYTIFYSTYQPDLMIRIARLWTMKADITRNCPYCNGDFRDILTHIIVNCLCTRSRLKLFFEHIRADFDNRLYNELANTNVNDFVLKLLGLYPTTGIGFGEVKNFQLYCFKFLKTITDILVIY